MVTEDGTEENMINKIVDACCCGHSKQYLVRWVGYDHDHDEWLSGKMLEDTEALDIWELRTVQKFDSIPNFFSREGCKDAPRPHMTSPKSPKTPWPHITTRLLLPSIN